MVTSKLDDLTPGLLPDVFDFGPHFRELLESRTQDLLVAVSFVPWL